MNYKKLLKGVIFAMGILTLLGTILGCYINGEKGNNGIGKNAQDNTSGIASFTYNYNGSIGANSYSYDVKFEDGKWKLYYDAMEYEKTYGVLTVDLDDGFIEKLNQLYVTNRLASWNGFDKYNPNVLDGYGFDLRIAFNDGKTLSASGSNAFPQGYGDFTEQLDELFKEPVRKMLDKAREVKIAQGIKGNLRSYVVSYRSNKAVNRDEFIFIVHHEGARENNYSVDIKSGSGQYLTVGRYNLSQNVPNEVINWPAMDELLRKYNVIKWYDYDEPTPKDNTTEFLSFHFDFDSADDLLIKANLTPETENYEAFRDELMALLFATFDKVNDK